MSDNSVINTGDGLLPNFCSVRVIFLVVLLTELFALVLSLAIPHGVINFWDYLAFTSFLMQWIALVNAAILCRLRDWLNKKPHTFSIPASFFIMSGVSFTVAYFSLILNQLLFFDDLLTSSEMLDELFLLRVMTISTALYAIVLRYFYIQQQWRLNLAAQAQSEIEALRARIRPHFLFNSMNTIASLIEVSPTKAETAIEDLSDLFRASLSDQNLNSIEDEIILTKSYLNIELLRLGERLRIQWNIDNSLNNIKIPALSLQPLVENAVYHGIEPLTEGGKICISALKEGKHLFISVKNPLAIASRQQYRKGNQMAQNNIKQRMALVYDNKAEFITNDTKDSYTATMKIPLN